jgi:hypothetical protein
MTKDVIEQVALVSGRVLNRGTALPFDGSILFDSLEGEVAGRVLEDGTFVVSGRPDLLFPFLATTAATFHVTMHAHSSEFTQTNVNHALSVSIAAAFPFDAPLDQGTISLPVNPADITANLARTIRGFVTNAVDPRPPLSGVTIDILEGGVVTHSTLTDGAGRFSFDDLVIAAPAEIRATLSLFKTQRRQLLIDFHLSMHEEVFRLVHV